MELAHRLGFEPGTSRVRDLYGSTTEPSWEIVIESDNNFQGECHCVCTPLFISIVSGDGAHIRAWASIGPQSQGHYLEQDC